MAQNKRPSSNRFKGFRKFFRKSTPQNDQKERLDYLQELFYQHRSFDVKGISAPGEATLPLAQVFVDVGLSAMPGKASTNPIPAMQKNAREKRYSIWRFLQSEPDKRPKNLVVLGAPSTGKTTLLKHLAMTLTQPVPNGHRLAKSPIF